MFNTLHTACFMHGLSIYEIKRICHRAYFFTISYGSFQHLTNFLKIWKNNTRHKYRAKSVVIFSQLLSFSLNYCPWHQTLQKMCKFSFYPMFWQDTAWYILAIRRKLEFVFRMNHNIKKSDVENLKNLFSFHGLLYYLSEKRKKTRDHRTNSLSGGPNSTPPP